MAVLKTITNSKYDEHVGFLNNGRRRRAELTENDMVKYLAQYVRWLAGCIAGDQSEQTAALTELGTIFATTVTPPTNLVGATLTELNTRWNSAVALTAGSNTVTFASTFADTDYTLTFICYTANGGMVQWTYSDSDKSATGFDIFVASNCKIDYIAIHN